MPTRRWQHVIHARRLCLRACEREKVTVLWFPIITHIKCKEGWEFRPRPHYMDLLTFSMLPITLGHCIIFPCCRVVFIFGWSDTPRTIRRSLGSSIIKPIRENVNHRFLGGTWRSGKCTFPQNTSQEVQHSHSEPRSDEVATLGGLLYTWNHGNQGITNTTDELHTGQVTKAGLDVSQKTNKQRLKKVSYF